jgi:hypothetical protein
MKKAILLSSMILSTITFANEVTQLDCQVTSVRKSLVQLSYDYTLGIEDHLRKLPVDIAWISKRDTINLSISKDKSQREELIVTYSTLENGCSGNMIEKINTKTLMLKNNKKIDLSKSNDFFSPYQNDPSNLDLYMSQDSISGKMRLRTYGKFNSQFCDMSTTDDVIVSFNCKSE